jgi:hypothetical protein
MRLHKATNERERIKVDVLVLGIFSLIAVLIWVAYSLYDTFIKSTIEPEVAALLEPLDPNIDSEVIAKLQDHYVLPEEFTILAVIRNGENGAKQIVPITQRESVGFEQSSTFEEEVFVGESLVDETEATNSGSLVE